MEMKLKQSEYNFIYDDLGKDQIVMYNSFTGALAVVKEEQYRQFTAYLENGKEIEDKTFLDNLLKCGYLVPNDVDEHFLVKNRMMEGRFDKSYLSLTIAPTMACNFRCVYCFEQGHYGNKSMDKKTQESIIQFVEKQISNIKRLNIVWYGGEPLLALPVVENLSLKFIELCKTHNVQYNASIVTNGFLLTREVAQKLKEWRVDFAQITVDGPQEIHDKRRPLVNGAGSYQTIMNNLEDIKGILPISLRINVDSDNLEDADQVVNHIKERGLLGSVSPYLGLVIPYNGKYSSDKCLSDNSYSKYNLQFLIKHHIPLQTTYPMPRSNYCGTDHINSWVIDDCGYMYKCWNDIAIPDKAIGNINLNYPIFKTDLLDNYLFFNPDSVEKCSKCKMLPVCLGGCPHSRIENRMVCEQRKFYMQDYIIECSRNILNQR